MRKLCVLLLLILSVSFSYAGDQTAANKRTAHTIFTKVLSNGGDFVLYDQLYASDFVNHGRTRDAGVAEDKAAAQGWLVVAPDLKYTPELLVAEGDVVAVLWRGTGTNTGAGNGVPATGRRVDTRGITIWRIVDGKVRDEWGAALELDMMQQLGLIPGEALPTDSRSHEYGGPKVKVSTKQRARNVALARSVFEQAFGQGKLELFDTLFAKGFVNHGAHRDSTVQEDIEGTRDFRTLAPDLKVSVTKTVAEGDLVTIVYTVEGTNSGAAMGLPATGKRFGLRGISIMRIVDNKIAEEWNVLDQLPALQQLGLIPPN